MSVPVTVTIVCGSAAVPAVDVSQKVVGTWKLPVKIPVSTPVSTNVKPVASRPSSPATVPVSLVHSPPS